jgi:Holliday junction resolvasome RuvABC endonuclease subunit
MKVNLYLELSRSRKQRADTLALAITHGDDVTVGDFD